MNSYFTFEGKKYENNPDGRALLTEALISKDTKQKTIGLVHYTTRRRYSINSLLKGILRESISTYYN